MDLSKRGHFGLFVADERELKKIVSLFGEDAVRVAEVLESVDEITDIQIADQTEIRLNTVRKTLYRLYDHSLVGLRRSRDKETGWFVFHWRLQPDQLEGFIFNQKRRVLEKLETRLRYEKNHEFYSCKTAGCKRYTFGKAFEFLFKCPACNKPMNHVTSDKTIETLTRKIEHMRRELGE